LTNCWPGFAVGGWAHRRASNNRFYWKPDLIEIGQKLAKLDEDIDLGKPGAQERLEAFRKKRKGLVDSIIQVRSIPLFQFCYQLTLDDIHEIELRRI
jgi:hypothetical protein